MKAFVTIFLLLPLFLKMCGSSENSGEEVRLAKVGTETIYLEDAVESMPAGLSSVDSAAYVRQFVQNKIKDYLLYEQASKNIPNDDEIDALVEDYRKSLIIHAYQQDLMNEKMQRSESDSTLQIFYENNRDRFIAGHDLVKGIFIKIPKSAPGLERLKRIYKKTDNEALQQIDIFCVQNGGQVEYFYDRWVLFVDLLSNASYEMSNTTEFLKTHSSLDVVVGDYEYLLYVHDYVPSGSTAPFEYVKDEVKSVVANMKKTEFIHRFENDLLLRAEKKGKITYFKVNPKKSNQ